MYYFKWSSSRYQRCLIQGGTSLIRKKETESEMPRRRILTTPRCKGVVPTVTVMNGTVKCLAGTRNNAQPVKVSQLPKVSHECDRDKMCPLDEGREDSSSVSETPEKISHSEDTTLAILCGCLYFLWA